LGVSKKDIPQLARNAMNDACIVTNPKRLSQKEIEEIYEKAL
jgi:alcohol dehydrogenase class IV